MFFNLVLFLLLRIPLIQLVFQLCMWLEGEAITMLTVPSPRCDSALKNSKEGDRAGPASSHAQTMSILGALGSHEFGRTWMGP